MVLRSVGVLSAGKIFGAIGVLVGLLVGGFLALFAAAGVAVQQQGNGPQIPGMFLGVGALIMVPLFYGFIGFITGIIYAALYNLIAGFVGGIELEFERLHPVGPTT
jgi:hypothetical protein